MKTMYSTYKRVIWYVVGGVAVLLCGYLYFSGKNSSDYKTFTVARTSIEDRVTFSGSVIPSDKVILSFEKTGRIVSLPVYVGKPVSAGDVLASLSSADSQAQLDQARASLLAEQATLADLKVGARPESVAVAQTEVTAAQLTLIANLQGVRDALSDAYTKADDAVHNTLDPLYYNDTTTYPTFIVVIPDSALKNLLETSRAVEEGKLTSWRTQNDQGYPDLTATSFAGTQADLMEVKTLIDRASSALAIGQVGGQVTQSNLDTWRASVGVARTTISAAMNKLNTAEQAYISSQASLTLAQQNLRVLQSGSSAEAVAAEEARVASAVAKVSQYQAEVNKSVLISPINGVVASKDIEFGQIVSPNQQIVSVISNNKFQITSNVSELDIGKLAVGQVATTTLDAYGSDMPFTARVIRVDPAETVIENSPAYGIRLEFTSEDPRIKSGMTANISIGVAHKDSVLAVPIRTITKVSGKSTVSVLGRDKKLTVKEITTGLTSPSGMVEVTAGLTEGDQVLLPQGL